MQIDYRARCFIDEALNSQEQLHRKYYVEKSEMFRTSTPASELLLQLPQEEQEKLKFCVPDMEEDDFFHSPVDVSVVPHGRYSPAFIHKHRFIEMIYVFQGKCTNHIQGRDVDMQAGDVGIIAPGAAHSIGVFTDDCLVYNYLIRTSTFEKTFFAMLSSNSVLSDFFRNVFYGKSGEGNTDGEGNAFLMFRTGADDVLRMILAQIFDESRRDGHYKNEMMDSMLMIFFIELIRRHEKDVYFFGSEDTESENLIPIFRYMQENYKTVTLGSMSGYFHYSERHMKRVIKKYTGYSFSENIMRIRMAQARHLLMKTALSVAEVSEEVGYADVSSFRYAFKKYYHVSPKEFRGIQM